MDSPLGNESRSEIGNGWPWVFFPPPRASRARPRKTPEDKHSGLGWPVAGPGNLCTQARP